MSKLKLTVIVLCAALLTSCDVNVANPAAPTVPEDKAPVINAFSVDNAILNLGQSTNLRWSATGTCRIEPLVGDVPSSGVAPITPTISTIYNLSCILNGQGVSRVTTVTVR